MHISVSGNALKRIVACCIAATVVVLSTCHAPINPPVVTHGSYTVLAWNDLGMHCIGPTYDQIVILPPYNNLWAQVIRRGDPPQIVTSGVTVSYRVDGNTYTYGKGGYSNFWDLAAPRITAPAAAPARNIGLAGKGLSGTMDAKADHFEAVGVPISPIKDDLSWTPYQVGVITVTDTATGATLIETRTTVPVSDEMNCAKCHGTAPTNAFADILAKHNASHDAGSTPVICASCHADAALGTTGTAGVPSLSAAMHGFHSQQNPQPLCYDCHPGAITQCSRSTRHVGTANDGNCTTCHGTLAQMAAGLTAGRQPWLQEPTCVACHSATIPEVDTGAVLYRNTTGHNGMYCESCHGSPHAMIPTNQNPNPSFANIDGYQVQQYQAPTIKTLGSCGACHSNSRGPSEISDFAGTHGPLTPEKANGCSACHTAIPSTTARWPHGYQWTNSNP